MRIDILHLNTDENKMGSESKSRKRRSSPSSDEEERRHRKKRHEREEKEGKNRKRKDKEIEKKREKSSRNSAEKADKKSKDKHRHHKKKKINIDIKEISQDDYFSKSNEFATWLKEDKNIYFSDLSSESAHELFSSFTKRWNKGKLELRYYEGISSGPRTAHNWRIKLDKSDKLEK